MSGILGLTLVYTILLLVGFLVFFLLFFLIIRPFVLWYLKINKRLKKQEETNELLRELIDLNQHRPTPTKKEDNHSRYMPQ